MCHYNIEDIIDFHIKGKLSNNAILVYQYFMRGNSKDWSQIIFIIQYNYGGIMYVQRYLGDKRFQLMNIYYNGSGILGTQSRRNRVIDGAERDKIKTAYLSSLVMPLKNNIINLRYKSYFIFCDFTHFFFQMVMLLRRATLPYFFIC